MKKTAKLFYADGTVRSTSAVEVFPEAFTLAEWRMGVLGPRMANQTFSLLSNRADGPAIYVEILSA